ASSAARPNSDSLPQQVRLVVDRVVRCFPCVHHFLFAWVRFARRKLDGGLPGGDAAGKPATRELRPAKEPLPAFPQGRAAQGHHQNGTQLSPSFHLSVLVAHSSPPSFFNS